MKQTFDPRAEYLDRCQHCGDTKRNHKPGATCRGTLSTSFTKWTPEAMREALALSPAQSVKHSEAEILSPVYRQWCLNERLPLESADELLVRESTTEYQRKWLSAFVQLWDVMRDGEQETTSLKMA